MNWSIEQLGRVKKIYSHDRCADGTGAAAVCAMAMWMLGKKNRQDYEIELIQYGSKSQTAIQPSDGCLFVDITPSINVDWAAWKPHAPIVLDHHPSARPVVEALGGIYGTKEESGTSLAFKHVLRPVMEARVSVDPIEDMMEGEAKARAERNRALMSKWEMFAELSAIRDTWQDKHPSWEAAQAMARGVLFYNPWKVIGPAAAGGSLGGQKDPWDFYPLGLDILRKDLRRAWGLSRGAVRFQAGGLKCGLMNCTEGIVSEACHAMMEEGDDSVDVACNYFMTFEDGVVRHVVSLRSKPGTVACNTVARRLGGGGHDLAAGFRVDSADVSVSGLIGIIRTEIEAVLAEKVLES